jgi:hypothetical protein
MDTQMHEEDDKAGYELEKNGYGKWIEGKHRALGIELDGFLKSPELSQSQRYDFFGVFVDSM